MPVEIEAMKIAAETDVPQRAITAVLMVTALFAIPLGWFMMIDAAARFGTMPDYPGREAFNRLQYWLTARIEPNIHGLIAIAVGLGFTVFLSTMRSRFPWWVFHPAGFAVSGSWSMALFAPSVFVSWAAKAAILRYGGMTSYRPASRFFAGLILGEFVAGMFWAIYGIILHKPMYNFLP